MSLSQPQIKNPATRFMQWRGGEDGGGKVTWYDKETEKDNEVTLPFSFIVLDELNTITGFSEPDHSGFWSNEVRNLQNDILTVRTKSGIKTSGTYANISDQIKAQGAKFAQSVYIAFKDESGELQIGNIKMAGSAMSAWIDFKKKFDVTKCAVFITDHPKKSKKGSNVYFVPVFEGQNMSEATKKEAVKLDEELQGYLNSYFNRGPDTTDNGTTAVVDEPAEDVEIEDLQDQKEVAGADQTQADTSADEKAADMTQDKGGDKINLSDVPF